MTQQEFDATIAQIMSRSWTATTLAEVFRPLSKADRNTITGALMDKGFNADILYAALGKAGFAPENDPNLPQVAYTPPKPKPRIPWLWIGLGLGALSLVFLGMGKRR